MCPPPKCNLCKHGVDYKTDDYGCKICVCKPYGECQFVCKPYGVNLSVNLTVSVSLSASLMVSVMGGCKTHNERAAAIKHCSIVNISINVTVSFFTVLTVSEGLCANLTVSIHVFVRFTVSFGLSANFMVSVCLSANFVVRVSLSGNPAVSVSVSVSVRDTIYFSFLFDSVPRCHMPGL